MMFDTVEELQAHYKAVKKRIEAKKPPTPKIEHKELVVFDNPVIVHSIRLKYEIKNGALVSTGKLGYDRLHYQQVVQVICREFDITPQLLFGRRRNKELVGIRHLCWAIARVMCPHMSLPMIGKASNSFDHTSVLHGIERAKERAKPFIKGLQTGDLRVD